MNADKRGLGRKFKKYQAGDGFDNVSGSYLGG
jgi:hypothetical protein